MLRAIKEVDFYSRLVHIEEGEIEELYRGFLTFSSSILSLSIGINIVTAIAVRNSKVENGEIIIVHFLSRMILWITLFHILLSTSLFSIFGLHWTILWSIIIAAVSFSFSLAGFDFTDIDKARKRKVEFFAENSIKSLSCVDELRKFSSTRGKLRIFSFLRFLLFIIRFSFTILPILILGVLLSGFVEYSGSRMEINLFLMSLMSLFYVLIFTVILFASTVKLSKKRLYVRVGKRYFGYSYREYNVYEKCIAPTFDLVLFGNVILVMFAPISLISFIISVSRWNVQGMIVSTLMLFYELFFFILPRIYVAYPYFVGNGKHGKVFQLFDMASPRWLRKAMRINASIFVGEWENLNRSKIYNRSNIDFRKKL